MRDEQNTVWILNLLDNLILIWNLIKKSIVCDITIWCAFVGVLGPICFLCLHCINMLSRGLRLDWWNFRTFILYRYMIMIVVYNKLYIVVLSLFSVMQGNWNSGSRTFPRQTFSPIFLLSSMFIYKKKVLKSLFVQKYINFRER